MLHEAENRDVDKAEMQSKQNWALFLSFFLSRPQGNQRGAWEGLLLFLLPVADIVLSAARGF